VSERDTALADFDRARSEFEEAIRRAPDAALRYRPGGEDYALGGLVVHVTDVLRHYTRVLETIHTADWQTLTAPEHVTTPADQEMIRDGFTGADRGHILAEMRAAHTALVEAVNAEPDEWFSRKAAVTYAGSSEPYPTSPEDVVGWVRDHYSEHTQQATDLVSHWAAATR
jgi:DinB superfamily